MCFLSMNESSVDLLVSFPMVICTHFSFPISAGIRAVHVDWYPGHVAGRQRDWSRLHIRHTQTPADDNQRQRQGPHTDMSQLPRPSPDCPRPAASSRTTNEPYWI